MKNLRVLIACRIFASNLLLGLLFSGLLLSGCAPKNSSSSDTTNPGGRISTQRLQLVVSDITDFATVTSDRVSDYDTLHAHAFKGIFGGLTGQDVSAFFAPRIKYFVTDYSQVSVTPDISKLQYQGWLSSFLRADAGGPDSGAQLGGQNLGTAFWFISLINNVNVDLIVDSQTIPASSSRAGVMLIGAAYQTSIKMKSGKTIPIPSGYRQGILVHEARHSDCTGGVTQADLDVARVATSSVEFTRTFPKMACGHFHTYCPDSMKDLAGLAACDGQPWGAYSVGFVYQAALAVSETDPVRKAVLEAGAVDSFSRLQFDTDAMLSGDDGPPDMSSAGLLQ